MRRILICTGILGGGTALTFAAAALTATMFPDGAVLPANTNVMFAKPGMVWAGGGGMIQIDVAQPAMPVPMPVPSDGVFTTLPDGTVLAPDGPGVQP
jgi:hypothetical protein